MSRGAGAWHGDSEGIRPVSKRKQPRLKMPGSRRGRHGRDGDGVAELAELVDGAVARPVATALVEVGGGWLLVALAMAQHVVDDDQQAVADGDEGLLPTVAGHKPPVVAGQGGAPRLLGPHRATRRLDQGTPQPLAALTGPAAPALAGALVVPGAHPRPGGQVGRAGEAGKLRPELRH